MSKQLTLSAFTAILSMAAFVLVADLGAFSIEQAEHQAGNAPLVDLYATR